MSYSNNDNWMQINFMDDNRIDTPPTTTTITTTTPTTITAGGAPSINNIPPPDEGRGARPIRRRSRVSRRTPTTLLNTDTTNFRAMVQQFTGSHTTSAAAATPHLANAAGIFDFTQHAAPPAGGLYQGVRVQYPNQMQQRHMFTVDHDAHGRGGGAAAESSSPNESRDFDNYML